MYYFVVNTASRSGKGAGIWKSIKAKLDEGMVVYKAYRTKYPGHATELARMICEKNCLERNLIIVGGDGTINEVVNGITDFSRIRIGIIPTGSGNDFCKGHGISLKLSPVEVLEDILRENPTTRQLDLGKVYFDNYTKSRMFAISSGIGLDAIVCRETIDSKVKRGLNKVGLGSLTYSVLTVHTLFSMTKFDMQVKSDAGERKAEDIIYSAMLLGPFEGGGVKMAPYADPADGLFDVCTAGNISKLRAFPCLPLLLKGKHTKLKAFSMEQTSAYEVEIDRPVALHTDGEYLGEVTQARFECLKNILTVINSEG